MELMRTASILTLWLNVFVLLFIRYECEGSGSMSPITVSSTVVPNDSSHVSSSNSNPSFVSSATTAKLSTYVTPTESTATSRDTKKTTSIHSAFSSSFSSSSSTAFSLKSNTQPILPTFSTPAMPTSPVKIGTFPTSSSMRTGGSKDSDDDSEPKTELYIWHLVAIGAGALVFILIIIIVLLCYQARALRKKLKTSKNYSLPIKENGTWIDNHDIPLWQKRASAFVSENPVADEAPTLTT